MTDASSRFGASRLALEMVVVIASILIAFALDAWWERRAEAGVEQAHLRALESDFEQNVARLEQLLEREGRTMAASRRLLDYSAAPQAFPEDSIGSFFGQVFNSGRFDPLMGAYEAVVSSGGLAEVRDDSLRLALADFASLLQNRYTERYADELYMDFIRRYTGRLGITAAVTQTDTARTSLTASRRGLLQDPTFQEHLALRYVAERDVRGTYEGLQYKARHILELTRRARR